jgi:cytochrome c
MALETNKLFAAVILGVIAPTAAFVFTRHALYHPHVPEEVHYAIAVPEGEGTPAEPAAEQPIEALLASASPEAGQASAKACGACHSFEEGGAAKVGPPLWNVVDREIASVEGFSYSDALAGKEGVWDYTHLNGFLTNPKEWAPGTKMAYAGIGKPETRADVIAYLRSLSNDPVPLPEPPAEEPATAEAAPAEGAAAAEGGGIAPLLAAANPEHGQSLTRACGACHSFEAGGPVKVGPPLYGVVGRDIASVDGFAYSDAMHGKDGAWDFDKLDHYLTNPKEWAPGTKMAYAGIKKDQDRADVIAYLRSLAEEPVPLPEAAAAPAEGGEKAEAAAPAEDDAASATEQAGGEQQTAAVAPVESGAESGGGIASRLASADAAHGESLTRVCAACHSFDEGGPVKVGPPLYGVVGRDIASVDGFAYSDAMQGKDGAWDYDMLDHYLTNPKEWAPGTKMAYAGVKKDQDRADVIAYLRSLSPEAPPVPGG